VIDNARRLEVDLTAVEGIVLSHGHYDHTTGMSGLLNLLGPAGLPVVLHPEAWTDRRIVIPDGDRRVLPTPSRSAIEGAGFEIVEEVRPSFLLGGSVLVTGEVDRTTPFETGFPGHEQRGPEGWHADPHIRDDQAIVVEVKDRGLVVLTGCGHAGVVNIVRKARALTGVARILAVVGGFHLGGRAFHARIADTVKALSSFHPEYLIPAHCTGFPAAHALAHAMPDVVIPNLVGTRYEF
jgi:7,8-dihydropterin-6-yl-methyl-4-(beta-D-ribofuranosyl)aminobenzene 5'-phosphate synthase